MKLLKLGAVVSVLWALGKLLAFGKDLVVSYYFGASAETDAYFIAANVPALVYAGLYATVPLVLLPLYLRKLYVNPALARHFVSSSIGWYALTAIALSIGVFSIADVLVDILGSSLAPATRNLSILLTKIFSLTFVFSLLSAALTTIQLAHRKVVGVHVVPILNNALFVVAVVLFAERLGILSAAIAASLAWVVQVPLQYWLVRSNFRYSFTLRLNGRDRRLLIAAFLPALLSVSVEYVNPLISIFFASELSAGAISHFSYAWRVLSLCVGVFVALISSIAYPSMAEAAAESGSLRVDESLWRTSRLTLLATIPIGVFLFAYSREAVALVFQRGAFSEEAVSSTAAVLQWLAVAIPFIASRELYVRAIYAAGKAHLAMCVGIFALLGNGVLAYLLVGRLGISGLGMAASGGAILSWLAGLIVVNLLFRQRLDGSILNFLSRLIVVVAVAIGTVNVSDQMLETVPIFLRMLLALAGLAAVYIPSVYILGLHRQHLCSDGALKKASTASSMHSKT